MAKGKGKKRSHTRTQIKGRVGSLGSKIVQPAKGARLDAASWVASGEWVYVISSNVRMIRYDKEIEHLYVQFLSGATYKYPHVTELTAKGMFNTTSMGSYVAARLKGQGETKL